MCCFAACAAVAVGVFGAGVCGAVVGVSEVPVLVRGDWVAASPACAGTCFYCWFPSFAFVLVCAVVSSLVSTASALFVGSGVLLASAGLWYEDGASGLGAYAHDVPSLCLLGGFHVLA